jgi:hypothetical protein
MNKIKRSVSFIMLLVYLVAWPSIAYGEEISDSGEYISVKKDQKVPFDGYLFDSSGLIKIITNKSLELEKLRIEKDTEIKKVNIDLEYIKKQHLLELKITNQLNDDLNKVKNERIKQLEESIKWHDLKLFGAMFLGIALSVAIFFVSVQVTNTKTP